MHLGPRGAAELQTHPSLNAIAIVPSGWMVAWSTRARQASDALCPRAPRSRAFLCLVYPGSILASVCPRLSRTKYV